MADENIRITSGWIENTPTDDYHIVHKKYVDDWTKNKISTSVADVDLMDAGTTSYIFSLNGLASQYVRFNTITLICTGADGMSGDSKIKIGHTFSGEEILAETTITADAVGESFVIASAGLNANATPGNDTIYAQVSSPDSGVSGTASIILEGILS